MGALLKMAIPPFHQWILEMMNYFNSSTFVFFLTLLKILPFFLLWMFISMMFFMLLLMYTIYMNTAMFFVWKIKELLIFSSGVTFIWLCISSFISTKLFTLYMCSYMIIIYVMFSGKQKNNTASTSVLLFIILMGTPPFLIFF